MDGELIRGPENGLFFPCMFVVNDFLAKGRPFLKGGKGHVKVLQTECD